MAKIGKSPKSKNVGVRYECDTICVCVVFSLSLSVTCVLALRCQTASPPLLHFTSHELVTIIQRHLFSLNVFLFLLSSFFYFIYVFFFFGFLSFAIGWWWHDALEQHHCSRGLFRSNTKHVPNYLMYTPPLGSARVSPITRWLVVWFFFFFIINKIKLHPLPYFDVTTIASYSLSLCLQLQVRGNGETVLLFQLDKGTSRMILITNKFYGTFQNSWISKFLLIFI